LGTNQCTLFFVKERQERKQPIDENITDFYRNKKRMSVYGMYDSTISRTEGWNFGKLGQALERADKTYRY
jgi:uncharacterized alpha-E superfamily protein